MLWETDCVSGKKKKLLDIHVDGEKRDIKTDQKKNKEIVWEQSAGLSAQDKIQTQLLEISGIMYTLFLNEAKCLNKVKKNRFKTVK